MLTIQELRIGNLLYDEDGFPFYVSSLFDDYMRDSADNPHQLEDIKPIKLDEDILLKCGAKKDGWEFKLKACALEITIRLNYGYVYCEFGNVYLGDRITYLHELQNLIYGLSKRELEVKL